MGLLAYRSDIVGLEVGLVWVFFSADKAYAGEVCDRGRL
jgi:hypothetical protein